MKTFPHLFILILLSSPLYKTQVKIVKLPSADIALISKANLEKHFELQSIRKTDSSGNDKTISYYSSNFKRYESEIQKFNKEGKIAEIKVYDIQNENQKYLNLFSEKQFSYFPSTEKILLTVWRKNQIDGRSEEIKKFDANNRLVEKTDITFRGAPEETSTIIYTYTYTFDEKLNGEKRCVVEFAETTTPKSFESCAVYLYKNGRISKEVYGNNYFYDKKERLIRDEIFNKGEIEFENLYLYNDQEKTMEHQRYRIDGVKFLAAKEQTFYNEKGQISKLVYYGLSDKDQFAPNVIYLYYYDDKSKEKLEVEFRSAIFKEKPVGLPF